MGPDAERSRTTLRRVVAGALVVALVTGAVLARQRGVDAESVQRGIAELGAFGPPLFVLVFSLAELIHLPGILFVVVARVVFGPALGFVLGYVGAVAAVSASFALARFVVSAARGAREPWRPKLRVLRRAFERLESRPVSTIAVLRLLLWFAPPLTYAIAATKVRTRDHLVGSALGLALPVLVAVLVGGLL